VWDIDTRTVTFKAVDGGQRSAVCGKCVLWLELGSPPIHSQDPPLNHGRRV
jgi:hypothetical protein